MKKEYKDKRTGNAYTYSNDEIRACMSEIRLLIAEEGENISDSEALQIIEDHVRYCELVKSVTQDETDEE